MHQDTIVLGGGCFWCLEAVFQRIQGIVTIESGYAGGNTAHPTYKQVCSGNTGHAEVVKISYDSSVLSMNQVFDLFFVAHDPTTLNRQGNDIGSQYRSIIFYKNDSEKLAAVKAIERAQSRYRNKIVTELQPLDQFQFYKAENYHQNYFNQNKEAGYCQYVIQPKLTHLGLVDL